MSDGHGGLATGTVGVNVKSGSTGGGWGDVHYTSFDGFKFNLQSTGDYVIAHATSGPEFEVDGRAENLGHTGVSYLTAVAVEAGDHLIVFDEAKPSTMLVDGHAVTFAVGDRLDLGDGVVIGRATATTHQIETPLDFVDMLDHGSYLDLSVHAGSAREPGSFEGLLGNLDGNAKNDFGLANGTWLANPNAKVIEGLFADAWRVGPQDNMLASLGHETFTQRLSDATHDHASAISVHDWHII
ncbi:VWD domain-containing protein [Bradyrhizobium sp. 1]|nr:VWD domain-containing protein [Bradyrhizobium sp. 1]